MRAESLTVSHTVLIFVLPCFWCLSFGRVVPPFAGITDVGMNVLGVFLGVIYGYSTCEIAWPSLFAFIAYGVSGYTSVGGAITEIMGQSIVFQSIVAFLCAGAITHYGFWKMVRPLVSDPENIPGKTTVLYLVLLCGIWYCVYRYQPDPAYDPSVCDLDGYCGHLRI